MFGKKGIGSKDKVLKVRLLLSPSAVFYLPHSVGEEVELPESLALELIETKYAEKVD